MSVSLTIDGYTDSAGPVFDGYAEVCASGYDSCLPPVELISDLELTSSTSCSKGKCSIICFIGHFYKDVICLS